MHVFMFYQSTILFRCKQWLELNLLKSYNVALLRELRLVTDSVFGVEQWVAFHSMELLVELLKSPDLYVMQVEMDVYTLAKRVS